MNIMMHLAIAILKTKIDCNSRICERFRLSLQLMEFAKTININRLIMLPVLNPRTDASRSVFKHTKK